MKELTAIQVENNSISAENRADFVQKNYLYCNQYIIDNTPLGEALLDKGLNELKMYTADEIHINKDSYEKIKHGELLDMTSLKPEVVYSNEYNLYLEPVIYDDNLSREAIETFMSEYLDKVTYPDKDNIKHNIAAVIGKDTLFEKALIDKGFVKIKDKFLYKIYLYITPNQFCRKNILSID